MDGSVGRARRSIPRPRGRRPYELSVMLRIHCVQLFYNLSDPGMEDMPMRYRRAETAPLPDET